MSKFENAVSQSCLEWASELPDDAQCSISPESQKYFNKLLKRMCYGTYQVVSKRTARFILIAAIIAAVFAAISIGANIGEQDFEIIPNGDMAQYKVIEPDSPVFKSDLEVDYIIPGFQVSEKMYDADNNIVGYEYSAVSGSVYSILRTGSDGNIFFDDDNIVSKNLEHNNFEFTYYISDEGYLGLLWNYGGYAYSIMGEITIEEAFSIADSINY